MATTPTEQTTVTSNVPEWARSYAMDILGFGKALTYPKQKIDPVTKRPMTDAQGKPILESGFQPYQGELVAGETPLQRQAYDDLSRMQVSPQTSQATGCNWLKLTAPTTIVSN